MSTARSTDEETAIAFQQYPVAFVKAFLPGVRLWSGMEMVLESVWQNKRTSVRACHGISKTFTAALCGVTFLNAFPNSIVITTAPTGRQVEKLLWKEIRALYSAYGDRLMGTALTTEVQIAPDWLMYGFSTEYNTGEGGQRGTKAEGQHAPAMLWIFDEAKGLPDALYNAAEGAMSGGFSRILEISTTDGADQSTPFRSHHTTKTKGWNCIRFSALDSPFVDPCDPRLDAYTRYINKDLFIYGRPRKGPEWDLALKDEIQIADTEWVLDRIDDWAETDADLLLAKVFGEFAEKTENNVIPLAWIEAAVNNQKVKADPTRTYFGLDIAEFGNDADVLTERQGGLIFEQQTWKNLDLMEAVGRVINSTKRRGPINVDVIGMGAGVWSRLVEQRHPAVRVVSGGKAFHNEDQFVNLRAEMWWHTRMVFRRNFKEGNVLSIPDDQELKAELAAMRYKTHSDGRILIEEKKEARKRLGRSPDKADSLVYCLADIPKDVPEELPADLAEFVIT